MAKSSTVLELNPESANKPRVAKPRKSRSEAVAAVPKVQSSTMKPVLIGIGVGAAVAATALVVQSQLRGGSRRRTGPTLMGTLAKAALVAVTRMVVQRAVRVAAEQAELKLANSWATAR